jgi:hypothetical protein
MMNISVVRGEWHGLSFEDLTLAIAGLIFAYVLARLFGNGRVPGRAPRVRSDRTAHDQQTPPIVDESQSDSSPPTCPD